MRFNVFKTLCLFLFSLLQESTNHLGQTVQHQQNNKDTNYDEYNDYDIYKSNVDTHASILHDYFKHFNHNYKQGYNSVPDQGINFYPVDRTDVSNPNIGTELFAGDIGESDLIKRDSNSILEPTLTQASVNPIVD